MTKTAEKPYSLGPHKMGVHPGRYIHQHYKAKKYIYLRKRPFLAGSIFFFLFVNYIPCFCSAAIILLLQSHSSEAASFPKALARYNTDRGRLVASWVKQRGGAGGGVGSL